MTGGNLIIQKKTISCEIVLPKAEEHRFTIAVREKFASAGISIVFGRYLEDDRSVLYHVAGIPYEKEVEFNIFLRHVCDKLNISFKPNYRSQI